MKEFVRFLDKYTHLYPHFTVSDNKNPYKVYAIPGALIVKAILLIPAYIFMFFLTLAIFVVLIVNSFYVLFNGRYWPTAYQLSLNYMRYMAKVTLYLYGLTDKYPWFNFDPQGAFNLEIPVPEKPNRYLAVPFFGIIVRAILIIPFYFYQSVIINAANIGIFLIGWIFVLFKGYYPEVLYELGRDGVRLSLSMSSFFAGLSDKYPSFKITLGRYKNVKLILIGIALLLTLFSWFSDRGDKKFKEEVNYKYNYQDIMDNPEGYQFDQLDTE